MTGSVLLVGCGGARATNAAHEAEEEVTPAEDLMREHGVLRRVMFLYDEAAMRFDKQQDVPLDALQQCGMVVRRVIEEYHEKIEEQFLFPRYEKAGKLADLVATLRKQHVTGRELTDRVIGVAKAPLDRAAMTDVLRRFNHMYRAHAAREDTVLFPTFRELVGAKAYQELGEQFEDKEKELLGDHGFEKAVDEVAALEKAFGVDDLAKL